MHGGVKILLQSRETETACTCMHGMCMSRMQPTLQNQWSRPTVSHCQPLKTHHSMALVVYRPHEQHDSNNIYIVYYIVGHSEGIIRQS